MTTKTPEHKGKILEMLRPSFTRARLMFWWVTRYNSKAFFDNTAALHCQVKLSDVLLLTSI